MCRHMKILYILPQPYLLPRGSSYRAQSTVDALAELGHDVDMLCYPIGSDPAQKRYAIHRAARPPGMKSVRIGPSPGKVLMDMPLMFRASAMARRTRYDVIHGVEEAGFIACALGRRQGLPFIYDMHSWMSQQIEGSRFGRWKLPLKAFRRFEQYAMRRASAILTVGQDMTERLRSSLAPSVYSVTLPDCPMVFPDPPDPAVRDRILREYFGEPRRTLLYTGNFHVYQGIDLLLKSIRELKNRIDGQVPFVLLLVGGGEGERTEIEKYRRQAVELGIERHVVFCGEHMAADIPVFLERADVLVSSRISGNNVPLKVYTFLSSGIPLVATRVPSHLQILNDQNSILAAPTPADFARALQYALMEQSDEQRKAMARSAGRVTPDEQRTAFREVLRGAYAECEGKAGHASAR